MRKIYFFIACLFVLACKENKNPNKPLIADKHLDTIRRSNDIPILNSDKDSVQKLSWNGGRMVAKFDKKADEVAVFALEIDKNTSNISAYTGSQDKKANVGILKIQDPKGKVQMIQKKSGPIATPIPGTYLLYVGELDKNLPSFAGVFYLKIGKRVSRPQQEINATKKPFKPTP